MTLGPLEFCDWTSYLRIHYYRSYFDLIEQPEPDVFEPPSEPDPTIDLKKEYAKSGLQVIVKLANIHLTPEKPSYDGGSWHVEGQLVSIAIFFLSEIDLTPWRRTNKFVRQPYITIPTRTLKTVASLSDNSLPLRR